MLALAATLTFAFAFAVAATALYATVRSSLPKICAALRGAPIETMLPPLPPQRVTVRRVTVRLASAPATPFRAAA